MVMTGKTCGTTVALTLALLAVFASPGCVYRDGKVVTKMPPAVISLRDDIENGTVNAMSVYARGLLTTTVITLTPGSFENIDLHKCTFEIDDLRKSLVTSINSSKYGMDGTVSDTFWRIIFSKDGKILHDLYMGKSYNNKQYVYWLLNDELLQDNGGMERWLERHIDYRSCSISQ